jgi:predicted unusual protein kinase regulating ubiquinone biosynthesis (AarF/ABC1/UbiB family)
LGIFEQNEKEVDLSEEANNLKNGLARYGNERQHIRITRLVKLYENQDPDSPIKYPAISTEYAPGVSLKDAWESLEASTVNRAAYLCRTYDLLSILYRKFFQEGFFKSGFVHSDLHGGNIKIDMSGDPKTWNLWILDFGNAIVLSKSDRQIILELVKAIFKNQPHAVVKAMKKAAESSGRHDIPERVWSDFRDSVHAHIADGRGDTLMAAVAHAQRTMGKIMDEAARLELPIPPNIVNLARAKIALEEEMKKFLQMTDGCDLCGHRLPTVEQLSVKAFTESGLIRRAAFIAITAGARTCRVVRRVVPF